MCLDEEEAQSAFAAMEELATLQLDCLQEADSLIAQLDCAPSLTMLRIRCTEPLDFPSADVLRGILSVCPELSLVFLLPLRDEKLLAQAKEIIDSCTDPSVAAGRISVKEEGKEERCALVGPNDVI